jgi:glycosyltransferase involved in cell wall biosynthesis
MACGRAIVSTPEGCRGLGLTTGVELIVAELDAPFSVALAGLLRDADLRNRLAGEARRTAELRFGWDNIARDALDSYAELTEIRVVAVG